MSQRLQHTIDFTDESTPTRRAKPAGVIGASNLRVAWASRPRTGPPLTQRVPLRRGTDREAIAELRSIRCVKGKPAQYPGAPGRWVNSRGVTGRWSETATATIGA